MVQNEKMIIEEIMQLLNGLEDATYGEIKANGLLFRPSASRFYYNASILYECVDELINKYSPKYVSFSDYKMICASQRDILLQLAIIQENRKMKDEKITRELEKYLTKLQGIISCISTYCKNQGCVS